MTIDEDEDPEEGLDNIESTAGKIAYTAIHHISKRLDINQRMVAIVCSKDQVIHVLM